MIQQASGRSNLKHVALELGGKSPNVVFADADCKCFRSVIVHFYRQGTKLVLVGGGFLVFICEVTYYFYIFLNLFKARSPTITRPKGHFKVRARLN